METPLLPVKVRVLPHDGKNRLTVEALKDVTACDLSVSKLTVLTLCPGSDKVSRRSMY